MLSTIEEYSPYIVFEVLNHYLAITNEDLDEETVAFRNRRIAKMEGLLRDRRYIIFNILANKGLKRVEQISPSRSGDLTVTDYVAVPQIEEQSFTEAYPGRVL